MTSRDIHRKEFAPQVDGLDKDKLYLAIRETGGWYWTDLIKHRRGRLDLKHARREVVMIALTGLGINDSILAKEIADSYGNEREKASFLFPGATDTLNQLRHRDISLALVSNGSSEVQRGKIRRFGLSRFFDYILIEGEFGVGKPDEQVFLHALGKLGAGVDEAWMIGDDLERDIAGAQKLGIYSIWVDWKGTGLPESSVVQPERIIKALSELLLGK